MGPTHAGTEFECCLSFSAHQKPLPARLRLDTYDLSLSPVDAKRMSNFRVPYCCIYGYEAPDQDSHITLYYVELVSPDLRKLASAGNRATAHILFKRPEDARAFLNVANELGVFPRPRRILLLVNPSGGIKKAKAISDTVVKPMLKHSGLVVKEQYTEYGRHAVDIAFNLNLDDIDTLVVISGDGVLHEVVNGLLSRPDWDQARRLVIGIIPAGSGNAVATSIGALRFEIAGFIRMIRLRRYAGKVYVLPPKHKKPSSSQTDITTPDSPDQQEPKSQHRNLLENTAEEPPKPWKLLPNMPFFSMLLLLNFRAVGENFLFSNAIRFNDGIMRLWYSCETRPSKIFLPFVMDQTNGKLVERGLMQDIECGGILVVPGIEGNPDDSSTHRIVEPDIVISPLAKQLNIYQRPGIFDVDGEVMPTARTLIEILPSFMDMIIPEWFHQEGDQGETTEIAMQKSAILVEIARARQAADDHARHIASPLMIVASALAGCVIYCFFLTY
ncbi:hypothetical protein BG011_009407 [Mortierella polycephala]|uniref:DAGKc domain-containing protein n=1 Tax=Mortierella polycephala TaxID=41804 RepID=A0A9P6PP89_9FUNG|nr:hypothetical protein BG011_009407 [Mortierella polycephala]